MARKFPWALGTVVMLGVMPFALFFFTRSRDRAEFDEQVRLARDEGIVVTWEDLAKTIAPAKPDENAALYYKQIKGVRWRTDLQALTDAVCIGKDRKAISAAKLVLKQNDRALQLGLKGSTLPRCWFDRDWSLGAAVLMPEYASLKGCAKLIALRAAIESAEGDPSQALTDVDHISALASHAGEEGLWISGLVKDVTERMAMDLLANLALAHPEERRYRQELGQMVARLHKPNLQKEARTTLYDQVSIIELCSTEGGMQRLGLKQADVSGFEKFAPILMNQVRAKTEMVKAFRRYWAELAKATPDKTVLYEAEAAGSKAMLAFPTAADIYGKLMGDSDLNAGRLQTWTARQQQYIALARGLAGNEPAKTIKTSDLLSPFNGKPLHYKFDGRQLTVTVSGAEAPESIKVPSDAAYRPIKVFGP